MNKKIKEIVSVDTTMQIIFIGYGRNALALAKKRAFNRKLYYFNRVEMLCGYCNIKEAIEWVEQYQYNFGYVVWHEGFNDE